jgi:hypothetical protein
MITPSFFAKENSAASQDHFPHVIVFVGTVGSGKSTQVKLLASELRKRGLNVKTTFIETNHIFAYLLLLLLARILARGKRNVSSIGALIEEKPLIFKKLFKLWLKIDLFSITLKFMLRVFLPVKVGSIVLVEGYIPATISDYVYISKRMALPLKTSYSTMNFMLRLLHVGGPTQVIFLDARANTLKSRWKLRGSLDERPDYVNMQRTTLKSLSEKLSSHGLLQINTGKLTIDETHKLIVNYLASFDRLRKENRTLQCGDAI